jgi:signal transduction histidine kinase
VPSVQPATPAIVQGLREACHDMRQPVASLLALAAAAMVDPALPETARDRLKQMVEQAEWLADLIQHALDTAVLGASGGCTTELWQTVSDALATERVTWPGEARIAGLAEPVFVAIHSVLLRRMAANLLNNAMRAAGPSGMVTVEVGRRQNLAVLAVEDSGPGFGKIEKGLGLGLSEVSRNAIRYGGRLECGNGATGGARISLWLPLAVAKTGPVMPTTLRAGY